MPHHPSEEESEPNIFDKVAQESKDSQASDHPLHDTQQPGENQKEKDNYKETIQIHSSKGPQIPDEMPEKASKDELKARAAELNQ